jgi:hypothetical protein
VNIGKEEETIIVHPLDLPDAPAEPKTLPAEQPAEEPVAP